MYLSQTCAPSGYVGLEKCVERAMRLYVVYVLRVGDNALDFLITKVTCVFFLI